MIKNVLPLNSDHLDMPVRQNAFCIVDVMANTEVENVLPR